MRAVVLATLLTTLLAARSAAASSASPPRDVAAVPMPASAAAATSALAAVRHEREQVWSALDPHLDGFYLDEDRAAVDLLDRYWSLTGEWVARYLDAHPRATTAELETALRELDRDVEARVLPVAGGFLVGTSQGEVGNVALVLPGKGGHLVAWNVKDARRSWSATGARGECRSEALAARDDGDACGAWSPLSLGALPADAQGHPRFFVEAEMAQHAGVTVGKEVSIWSWDGNRAVEAMRHGYQASIEEGGAPHLDGDELVVPGKGELRTMFAAGASPLPHVEWRARIAPTGVQDLGVHSLDLDLTLLDEILVRLQRHRPVDDLASPAAARALTASLDAWDAKPDDDGLRRGMLMTEVPPEHGDRLCVSIDGFDELDLRFAGRGATRTLVAARSTTCPLSGVSP